VFLAVVELKDSSMASKAPLSLIELSIVLGVRRSSLSILVLEVSNISNRIVITKVLGGN